jgi:hypothetical protein
MLFIAVLVIVIELTVSTFSDSLSSNSLHFFTIAPVPPPVFYAIIAKHFSSV